ncbi:hypothetical protein DPMN_052320 [Dreissena polymorpha]|uniref:Uncharacterized protein n=1 Tax=Dreissena polymorpha TaxID=45954 RepID=A0A9D4CJH7_DREPO|nr:hypothetical protein DPMN_052320 [Dreissena polymorpha]
MNPCTADKARASTPQSNVMSPAPRPSNTACLNPLKITQTSLMMSHAVYVCGFHQPIEMKPNKNIIFAKWAQCDGMRGGWPCLHWVHLSYCCPTVNVENGDKFYCPHCVDFEE